MTQELIVSAILKALDVSGIGRKLIASGGSQTIDDASAHTGLRALTLIAQEDTAISVATATSSTSSSTSSATIDLKSTRNWSALKAGAFHVVPDGYFLSALTLTSGSVILYS